MQRTWTEENLRILDIVRNSGLYQTLRERDLSEFKYISKGIGTKTRVYRVGHIMDTGTGNPIYVALKQIIELPGFIIAYHEFLDRLGFPVPSFVGEIKKENKGYCITEDLTLGGTVELSERNFEDDKFSELANKE